MDETSVTDLPPVVMTREEARAAGLKLYTPQKPCLHGHHGPVYVSTNRCKPCLRVSKQKNRAVGPRCSVDGCNNARSWKGLCSGHSHKFVRHGDPLGGKHDGDGLRWLSKHVDYSEEGCLFWPFGSGRGWRGYGCVFMDGKTIGAHVAMCTTAHGERPSSIHEAAHSCGNGRKACVHPGHLRWATPKENTNDKRIHGTMRVGSDVPQSKLTEDQVRQIRNMHGTLSHRKIAKLFGVSKTTIQGVLYGIQWKHVE